MSEIKNCDYLLDNTRAVLQKLVKTAPFLMLHGFFKASQAATIQ